MASRNRSMSSLSGPDKPVIVPCKELKEGLLSSMKDTYLWVDVIGVKFIDGISRKVLWFSAFNEITSWAVDADHFKMKLTGRKGKLKQKTFLTGNGRATELKNAIETHVKLYLHQPELVAELQKVAADLPVGAIVSKTELELIAPYGSGVWIDPNLISSKNGGGKLRASGFLAHTTGYPRGEDASTSGGGRYAAQSFSGLEENGNVWESKSDIRGFPAQLIEDSAIGKVVTDVIVIVRADGVHTINKSARQGDSTQRTFLFPHADIIKTRVRDGEFQIVVRTQDAQSTIRYVLSDMEALVEALYPYIDARIGVTPPPAPGPAPPMFLVPEGTEEEEESDDEDEKVAERVQRLAGIMESCLGRLGDIATEEALLQECMDFMDQLNEFVEEV